MEKNERVYKTLTCGCIVDGDSIGIFCDDHTHNQCKEGDPLYKFLATKEIDEDKAPDTNFVSINFINDGKKPMHIRLVPTSHQDNPSDIKPLEMKELKIRPQGFMKLWDYENFYSLLVD